MRVWKANNTGHGKVIPFEQLCKVSQKATGLEVQEEFFDNSCSREWKGNKRSKDCQTSYILFQCSRGNCRITFSTLSELETHLDVGKHYDREDDRNMYDRLRQDWAAKLSSIDQTKTNPVAGNNNDKARTNKSDCRMGWALQKTRPKAHVTTSAKQYLTAKFDIGERTGEKAEPNQVALDMRTARNENDERQFQRERVVDKHTNKGIFFHASLLQEDGKFPFPMSTPLL